VFAEIALAVFVGHDAYHPTAGSQLFAWNAEVVGLELRPADFKVAALVVRTVKINRAAVGLLQHFGQGQQQGLGLLLNAHRLSQCLQVGFVVDDFLVAKVFGVVILIYQFVFVLHAVNGKTYHEAAENSKADDDAHGP